MRQRRYEMQKCNNDKNILIWDNETGECLGFTAQIKGRLNLQDDIIKEQEQKIAKLVEENKQLKELIKENVFQRYTEGSLADLEFKATAYDDIVKLEMSDESEPKVIVSCRQGKKENVKSFCQMFIPFGVYYEIKELEE